MPTLTDLIEQIKKHKAANDLQAAERVCMEALALGQHRGRVFNILGKILIEQNKPMDALAAFNEGLKAEPTFLENYSNMAEVFSLTGYIEKAGIVYRQMLALDPKNKQALRGLLYMHQKNEELEKAEEYLAKLKKLEPENPILDFEKLTLCPQLWPNNEAIDSWRKDFMDRLAQLPIINATAYQQPLAESKAAIPFSLTYQGRDNLPLRRAYADHFFCESKPLPPKRDTRIRVGFYVDRNREHLFVRILGGMFQHWKADDIIPIIICHSSDVYNLKHRIQGDTLEYAVLKSDAVADLATIRALNLDILYFWEVYMSAYAYFLAMHKPARAQATGWGNVESSGLPQMDYFISSIHQETGSSQDFYSEKLIKLSHIPAYYPTPAPLKFAEGARESFQFSDGLRYYVCPQTPGKLHPDMLDIFNSILETDTEARIVVVAAKSERIIQTMSRHLEMHIPNHRDRVVILPYMPQDRYYALLCAADVILDPLYYGGGQTSFDMMAAGVPVITLPGETIRSRTTFACYQQMELEKKLQEKLVAISTNDYIAKAVEVAKNKKFCSMLKTALRERCTALYEIKATADEHMECFRAIAVSTSS